jgi:hypothetical protein
MARIHKMSRFITDCSVRKRSIKTPLSQSVSELYQPSDRRLSANLVPTSADRGCHLVNVTDPYCRILGFLERSCYFFYIVAPQLYSRGWVDPVPDPLLLRISDSTKNWTRTSWSVARNPNHYTTEGEDNPESSCHLKVCHNNVSFKLSFNHLLQLGSSSTFTLFFCSISLFIGLPTFAEVHNPFVFPTDMSRTVLVTRSNLFRFRLNLWMVLYHAVTDPLIMAEHQVYLFH